MVYGIRVYHEHIYDIRYYSYDYLSLILHYYSYDCIHARMQVREKVASLSANKELLRQTIAHVLGADAILGGSGAIYLMVI